MLGSPTTVSVASAGSRSAPNTTALQLVRVAPCDLGAVSRAPEIASTIALMYSQRLDRFLDNQKAVTGQKKLTVAKVQCALASGHTHTSPEKPDLSFILGLWTRIRGLRPPTEGFAVAVRGSANRKELILIGRRCAMRAQS